MFADDVRSEGACRIEHGGFDWMGTQSVVSLYEVLRIRSDTFSALSIIAGCRGEWKLMAQLLANSHRLPIAPPDIPMETRAHFLRSCEILVETAGELQMNASGMAAMRCREECFDLLASPIGYDHHRLARIVSLSEQLLQVFGDELAGRKLFRLRSGAEALLADEPQFGGDVEDAFPSAAYDIQESARCLALERWTASVMHVMRAMEVGLLALADHYGVAPGENWNQTLNQIEARSREVGRKTHGPDAEAWAAEAAAHLRFVKNAWRNHAMHPKSTYDEARAQAIFNNCRAFMGHLATKLADDPSPWTAG